MRLNGYDGSLEQFVKDYCEANGIRHNKPVFEVAFRGSEGYTRLHAETLIEVFADLFCLHNKESQA